jgi:hypothetical protein
LPFDDRIFRIFQRARHKLSSQDRELIDAWGIGHPPTYLGGYSSLVPSRFQLGYASISMFPGNTHQPHDAVEHFAWAAACRRFWHAVEQEGAAESPADPTRATSKQKQRGKGGRRPSYDWGALKELLAQHVAARSPFGTPADLVTWCIENVQLRAGARKPKGDGPDPKTAKKAIEKYRLHEIGLRGNRGN